MRSVRDEETRRRETRVVLPRGTCATDLRDHRRSIASCRSRRRRSKRRPGARDSELRLGRGTWSCARRSRDRSRRSRTSSSSTIARMMAMPMPPSDRLGDVGSGSASRSSLDPGSRARAPASATIISRRSSLTTKATSDRAVARRRRRGGRRCRRPRSRRVEIREQLRPDRADRARHRPARAARAAGSRPSPGSVSRMTASLMSRRHLLDSPAHDDQRAAQEPATRASGRFRPRQRSGTASARRRSGARRSAARARRARRGPAEMSDPVLDLLEARVHRPRASRRACRLRRPRTSH